MKTRYLVKVYKIENVKEYPEGLDDIVEQTEDQLDCNKHFVDQLQGDSTLKIAERLVKY